MESSAESFLTVAEVAEILKLNQQTVRNWIDQGSLPALRVGRRVRIKRSDFERVLEQSYSSGLGSAAPERGPTAEDFWGGTPVGLAEPNPLTERARPADPGAPATRPAGVDREASPPAGDGSAGADHPGSPTAGDGSAGADHPGSPTAGDGSAGADHPGSPTASDRPAGDLPSPLDTP